MILSYRVLHHKKEVPQKGNISFVTGKWLEKEARKSAILSNQLIQTIPNQLIHTSSDRLIKRQARVRTKLPLDRESFFCITTYLEAAHEKRRIHSHGNIVTVVERTRLNNHLN